MKFLITILVIAGTIQAHAAETKALFNQGRMVTSVEGCKVWWQFQEAGDKSAIGNVSWTGSCPGKLAEGYGWVSQVGSESTYFTKYSAGRLATNIVYQIQNGDLYAFSTTNTSSGIEADFLYCQKNPKCAETLKMLNKLLYQAPASASPRRSGSNSGNTSNAGNSGSSRGNYSVTPKPASYLTEAPSMGRCDVPTITAALKKYSDQIAAQYGAEAAVCMPAIGMQKIAYYSLTMVQKSCIPGENSDADEFVAGMKQTLKDAMEMAEGSCSP